VFAPDRVLTAAHVVAGTGAGLAVTRGDGSTSSATVVLYDPELDIAILRANTVGLDALHLDARSADGDRGWIVGYVDDSGRAAVDVVDIAERKTVTGPDFYGKGTVSRDVYRTTGQIRPGQAGGPLLSGDGRAVGLLFARAVDAPDSSYALTAAELAAPARDGASATKPSSTGACD
jgi:S1-C subfamily serine protease